MHMALPLWSLWSGGGGRHYDKCLQGIFLLFFNLHVSLYFKWFSHKCHSFI